jgi:hypothetical protein
VLEEIDGYVARSDLGGAVRAAFPRVMNGVGRAFGTVFPPRWTARDVLAHGLRSDAGNPSSLLLELSALYEPVRFGRRSDWISGDLRELVRRIYSETPVGKRHESLLPQFSLPSPPGSSTSAVRRASAQVGRW